MLVLLAIVTITIQTVLVFLSLCIARYRPAPFITDTSVSIKAYRASNNVHLSVN